MTHPLRCKSALVPSADALKHLSEHLLTARPHDRLVHYPGTPQPKDLDVVSLTTPPADSPLSREDLNALRTLREDLSRICTKAKERNVKVIYHYLNGALRKRQTI